MMLFPSFFLLRRGSGECNARTKPVPVCFCLFYEAATVDARGRKKNVRLVPLREAFFFFFFFYRGTLRSLGSNSLLFQMPCLICSADPIYALGCPP
ncbi:hypothetical protein ASPWEDRAFT_412176 [Aspergillus wentii DTO 134E9]|uniref:Uncharacterized protein n=1 Tax=Aspergillus wentii DTO 134E9 TaxID=1073089 RepID=A0A1L9RNL3_ASPWE|nr:uncharacterized protein ASPWEDRAFT_412176 [Aspergillus wentii DTO 134E9]OJJ36545.1 hypothetical protein ASPWEDRAFT_412176 [Aspergillus wentii DTO 134E9]